MEGEKLERRKSVGEGEREKEKEKKNAGALHFPRILIFTEENCRK